MNKVILYKKVNKKERYYNISIHKNLFDEYVVERIYGNSSYKAPVGIVNTSFKNIDDAKIFFKFLLDKKLAKGYNKK